MKNLFSILVFAFLFSGCSGITLFHTCKPQPVFQSMSTLEPIPHTWEDMMCKSVRNGVPVGEYKQMHAFTSEEWQREQENQINARIYNNICATSVNNYLDSRED